MRWLVKLLTGGLLDRVLDTVDRRVEAESEKNSIRRDIIVEHYRTRSDYMRAGGFYLMLMFAVPLAFWFGAVVVYSVLWCSNCAYPQDWTIAALPPPLDQWAGGIILSVFGVVGLARIR